MPHHPAPLCTRQESSLTIGRPTSTRPFRTPTAATAAATAAGTVAATCVPRSAVVPPPTHHATRRALIASNLAEAVADDIDVGAAAAAALAAGIPPPAPLCSAVRLTGKHGGVSALGTAAGDDGSVLAGVDLRGVYLRKPRWLHHGRPVYGRTASSALAGWGVITDAALLGKRAVRTASCSAHNNH